MGDPIIGPPRVAGTGTAPRALITDRVLPDPRPRAETRSLPLNDGDRYGGSASPRADTPAPRPGTPSGSVHPPLGPREVTPEESRQFLDEIRKGHRDPDRWRTARPITEGLRNGTITQDQLDSAVREGEGALARHFLDKFGRGGAIDADGQRFIDKGLERGDITREQMTRATEDRESYLTLESLRRGNGRLEPGTEPTDHAAIRRGIERGLFTKGDVDAANREGEQRKRDAMM